MNANDVIEAYVNDVAVQLPRKQRNDVAFELRALLNEELQARADESGRAADASMAIELLQAFGHPALVAARYRPTLTIIDPADGRAFLRLSVIGLLVIWALALIEQVQQPVVPAGDFLLALSRWWGFILSTVVASMWWPGVLVVGYAIAGWTRHHSPSSDTWKPAAVDRIPGGRAALMLGLAGVVCGLAVLIDPRWVLDVFWGGRAASAAYEALTYTDSFRYRQGIVLWWLVALNIPLLVAAIVKGRWTGLMRRVQTIGSLATCAAMAWAVAGGPIFIRPAADNMTKGLMLLIIVLTLVDLGIKLHRSVKPTPDRMGSRLAG
jgi:hypothetical protein